jgi:hypothetical protein
MVVEDDGGRAAGSGEVADDERVAARAQDPGLAPRGAHEGRRGIRPTPHVGAMGGVRGDGGDLDELAERALVLGPDPFSILIESGAAKRRHPRIMPERARGAPPRPTGARCRTLRAARSPRPPSSQWLHAPRWRWT